MRLISPTPPRPKYVNDHFPKSGNCLPKMKMKLPVPSSDETIITKTIEKR
jgi:hypothetical protein